MAEVTTNFRDSSQGDLGKNLVSKEYLINVYPKLASSILDPQIWCWGGQDSSGTPLGLLTKDNSFNRFTPIPFEPNSQTTGWKDVCTGVGLKKDGTLWVWDGTFGDNTVGRKSTPVREATSSTNWKKIFASSVNIAAIKTDGTLWIWGYGPHGELANNFSGDGFVYGPSIGNNLRTRSSPVQEFTSSTNWSQACPSVFGHILAIKTDGTLWASGANYSAQLGIGTRENRSTFTQVGASNNWKKVSTASESSSGPPGPLSGLSVGLQKDGSMWIWGQNYYNRAQIFGASTLSITPRQIFTGVSVPTNITGDNNTFSGYSFISNTGMLYTWGANFGGAVGNNTRGNDYVMSPVREATSSTNWKQICSHNVVYGNFVGIKQDGTLWSWGQAGYGQLGVNLSRSLGTTRFLNDRSSPIQEWSSSTNWKQVSLYGNTVLAIKTNGELWGWGSNNTGQLGLNDNTNRLTPVRIGTESSWNILSSGVAGDTACAIKTNGTLWTWGGFSVSKLGTNATVTASTPVQEFTSSTNWIYASHGSGHIAAIKSDGSLWLWGSNDRGQLGINVGPPSSSRPTPVQEFSSSTNWVQCACGGNNTYAIKSDGTLWSTGSNYLGSLAINRSITDTFGGVLSGNQNGQSNTFVQEFTSSTNWKMVQFPSVSGFSNTLQTTSQVGAIMALKTDGSLWSWGNNFRYQMGFNGQSYLLSPVREGTQSLWKDIGIGNATFSAGIPHGIKQNGTLWRFNPLYPYQFGGIWAKLSISGSFDENIHFIATDGTLWSVGNGQFGSAGSNSSSSTTTPIQEFTKSTNWKYVKSAGRCVFAVQSLISP